MRSACRSGERTEIRLDADEVIHSFWIPSLAGKMDMFPGRETRMAVEPEAVGTYRGQCAEFCGASHALMAFQAVVMEPDAFDAWLEKERGPAAEPADDRARRGEEVFLAQGCGACHAVRGTPASKAGSARISPMSAGAQPWAPASCRPMPRRFPNGCATPVRSSPRSRCRPTRISSDDDLAALSHYLEGLK